jgi:hypothetical protein
MRAVIVMSLFNGPEPTCCLAERKSSILMMGASRRGSHDGSNAIIVSCFREYPQRNQIDMLCSGSPNAYSAEVTYSSKPAKII